MITRPLTRLAFSLGALTAFSTTSGICQGSSARPGPGSQVEDIYIARSWRESRVTPTDFCAPAKIGFGNATYEDRYTFRSTKTRASDGLVVNTNANPIGSLRACFGSTVDSVTTNFYGEGTLNRVAFVGKGECVRTKQDFPEQGLTVSRCFLELRSLPATYVGGQLTTNTVNSRNALGGISDPPGYTQPSIATIRLWKRR